LGDANFRENKYFSENNILFNNLLNNVTLVVIVQQCNLEDQATDFVVY